MDQSASLLCRAGHALLLDCRSLETSQVPFDPAAAGASLLLINTRARHELTDGEYGQRRAECEEAARRLGIPSLRDLTDLADIDSLTDPVLRRRVRHVVTDNQRVLDVVALLRAPSGPSADTYPEIGRLLTQAHASLRDDFEVSWPEADVAVEAALAAGAAGARMIGGGFGGSVLGLVPAAAARCGQGRGDRGVRPARLDRAGVPGRRPGGQRPAGERLRPRLTGDIGAVIPSDVAPRLWCCCAGANGFCGIGRSAAAPAVAVSVRSGRFGRRVARSA